MTHTESSYRRKQIATQLRLGKSKSLIAYNHNVSLATVIAIASHMGINRINRDGVRKRDAEIRASTLPRKALSNRYGLTVERIRQILKGN